MASQYHLAKDFEGDINEGVISASPYWLIAVMRFDKRLLYDRANLKNYDGYKLSDAISITSPTLIIGSDAVSLSVQGDKSNFQKGLQATLLPTKNYLNEIFPADWIFAWMFYGKEKLVDLVKRIRKGEPCNNFDDGLKFVGKVQSIRKNLSVNPGSGVKTVRYTLQASSFNELGCQVFYNPLFAMRPEMMSETYARMNAPLTELLKNLRDDSGKNGIVTDRAIPTFLELLLGSGLPTTWTNPAGIESMRAAGLTNKIPIAVPKVVGGLLGKVARSGSQDGILCYTDVLESIIGVQKYSSNLGVDPNDTNGYMAFVPDGITKEDSGQYKYTHKEMEGVFQPIAPNLSNKTVWTVLQQWLNNVVNEMYTALRVNNQGKIVPTLVLRQLPYSTPTMTGKFENDQAIKKQEEQENNELEAAVKASDRGGNDGLGIVDKKHQDKWMKGIKREEDYQKKLRDTSVLFQNITGFLELPRWYIDPVLITSYDFGRADSLRSNFVRIYGAPTQTQLATDPIKLEAKFAPIRDDLDIQLNGLRMQTQTVVCTNEECAKAPTKWMAFASDFLIGQHLMYTGTVNLHGIQAPIAEGDNVEFDNTVLHIEVVSHVCNIAPDGKKSFMTSLTLGHGLDAAGNPANPYPGMEENSNTQYEPGMSVEDEIAEEDK